MSIERENGSPKLERHDAGCDSQRAAAPADLAAFDDAYEEAEAPSFEELPDGRYQVRIHDVKLGRNRRGHQMVTWDLVVIDGPHLRRHIWKYAVITPKSLPFVKGDLQTLGVRLVKFSDLPDHFTDLVGLTLAVTQRTNDDDFVNIYFNRRIKNPTGTFSGDGLDNSRSAR